MVSWFSSSVPTPVQLTYDKLLIHRSRTQIGQSVGERAGGIKCLKVWEVLGRFTKGSLGGHGAECQHRETSVVNFS